MSLPATIASMIELAAAHHGIAPEFARAVAWVESRGDAAAVSPAGAVGVFQLMPRTALALGVRDPFDAAQNIEAGVRYLARLEREFGRERALAAYNWGEGHVRRNEAPPSSVRAYVRAVLARVPVEARELQPLAMVRPVPGPITSPFGWRRINGRADYHAAVDLQAAAGTPVRAALDGRALALYEPGEMRGYGRTVVLQHGPSLFSLYAHLQSQRLHAGRAVKAGEIIAESGRSGGARGAGDETAVPAHLHFELVRAWPPAGVDRDRIDPSPFLSGAPLPRTVQTTNEAPEVARGPGPFDGSASPPCSSCPCCHWWALAAAQADKGAA